MMRRGPLADYPVEQLLDAAAEERASGVIELHGPVEGLVYLVEGDVYLADLLDREPIEERLHAAGLLTREQIARHTEPGDDGPYLALALDTDETIDDRAIGEWLIELTASTLEVFLDVREGEYELDPYGSHPAGILASWRPAEVFERVHALRSAAAVASPTPEPVADDVADPPVHAGASEPAGSPVAADPDADDVAAAIALPPPPEVGAGVRHDIGSTVSVVLVDAVPDGSDRIELDPVEWRLVVAAAPGATVTELAADLELDEATVTGLVEGLRTRGLVETRA